jgi:hypothetical protein
VIGLSHHNAKVEVREKLAIPEDQWNEAATVCFSFTRLSSHLREMNKKPASYFLNLHVNSSSTI